MTDWRTSSFSNGNAGCVEVRPTEVTWFVRDSKDARVDAPTLTVPAAGWAALMSALGDV